MADTAFAPIPDPITETKVTTATPPPAAAVPPPAPTAALAATDFLKADDTITGPTTAGAGPRARNVQTTTFEDDSIRQYDFDIYKGRNGVTDRIGILVPTRITFGRVHYTKDAGYFICHSEWKQSGGQEVCTTAAPCCEKLDTPRKRFACLVIHYNTLPNGQLIDPFSFSLKLWRFSDDRYIVLRDLNREFPLGNHDLKCNCTDDQFQKMTIQVCREKITNSDVFKQKFGADVNAWLQASLTKLERAVGRIYTPQELLEKLGMAQAPTIVATEAPIQDIRELLK